MFSRIFELEGGWGVVGGVPVEVAVMRGLGASEVGYFRAQL